VKIAERKENPPKIYSHEQLDRAHRDIKTAVGAGLFMGGLNILLLLILIFNPVYAAKTNWLGIGSIAIGIPIIFGCIIGIDRYSSIAAKAITAYFIISTILYIYFCWCGFIPTTLMMLTFIPFAPYLLYGLHRGRCGTAMLNQANLDESLEQSIDLDSENSLENFAETKFRQQFDRAHKNIETGVKSGLLMGGITFCINITLFYLLSFVSQMMLIFILPLDVLAIFGSTLEIIYQKKSSSVKGIIGYSIFSLIVKTQGLGSGGILFLLALLLSTYCFYGLYQGIVGISDLKRLTEMRADFDRSLQNFVHNHSDADGHEFSQMESASKSVISTAESREIMLEVERRDRIKQAQEDIEIAKIAALVIGVLQFLAIASNPTYVAKIGGVQYAVIIVNTLSLFGCAYGLSRQSQLAARMMMVCFVVNLIIDICSQNFNIFNIALMSYLLYGAYKGIKGTSVLQKPNLIDLQRKFRSRL
jgi:hypothetical protein